jgi:hypothetical protein
VESSRYHIFPGLTICFERSRMARENRNGPQITDN